jgi:hypothetical protein
MVYYAYSGRTKSSPGMEKGFVNKGQLQGSVTNENNVKMLIT